MTSAGFLTFLLGLLTGGALVGFLLWLFNATGRIGWVEIGVLVVVLVSSGVVAEIIRRRGTKKG